MSTAISRYLPILVICVIAVFLMAGPGRKGLRLGVSIAVIVAGIVLLAAVLALTSRLG